MAAGMGSSRPHEERQPSRPARGCGKGGAVWAFNTRTADPLHSKVFPARREGASYVSWLGARDGCTFESVHALFEARAARQRGRQ